MLVGWMVGVGLMAVPGPTQWTTPTPRPSIIGGEPTAIGEFDPVVAIEAAGGLCTGTLVAPDLVLTAGHCLTAIRDPAHITVRFGPNLRRDPDVSIGATDFGVHPDLCTQCKTDIHDYGYVVIDGRYSDPEGLIPPITAQEEWDERMQIGESVTLVGYGEDPDAESKRASIGVKRKVTTSITQLSPEGLEFFAGGGLRDSCEGDSGGPAFVQLTSGAWRLAGITSRGSSPCGDGGFYGVPYPALAWLSDATSYNLCGEDCPDCSCLDLTPEEDEGCQCQATPSTRPGALPCIVLAAGWMLRRRRPSNG